MENPLVQEATYGEGEVTNALRYKEFPVEGDAQKAGIRTTSGQLVWEFPSPELITLLHQADPRIEYFPSEVPPGLKDKYPFTDQFAWDNLRNSEAMIGRFATDRLSDKIKEEFKDRLPVAVRGLACSVNGGVFSSGILVRDIRDILQLGEGQGRDFALFSGVEAGHHGLHERTNQYLATGAEMLRIHLAGDPKSAGKLFPVLLVYDKDKLVKGHGYSAQLPVDKGERSRVILKAYILDCPVLPRKP